MAGLSSYTRPHVLMGCKGERPSYGHCVVETLYESHGILPFGGAQDGKKGVFCLIDDNILIPWNTHYVV